MKYDYDILTIGMGPAGMAVSAMGAGMGLRVCAIERDRIGGECMNTGCIPSKALLRTASLRHSVSRFASMELDETAPPGLREPFARIRDRLEYINSAKTMRMFDSVELVLGRGSASFRDSHTVEVDGTVITARNIFIATGSAPSVPPVPGIADVDILTNENLFELDSPPDSMVVLGGGAIGSEMAQAFSRLGTEVTVVHMDRHLLPFTDGEDGRLLESSFEAEGIRVINGVKLSGVSKKGSSVTVETDRGDVLSASRLLVAAGRTPRTEALSLGAAGIGNDGSWIKVNRRLRTSSRNIFAVGDVNGNSLFSHAAMHQGMVALMNCMIPRPFGLDFRRYVVPWTVFTEPEVSHVGALRRELEAGRKRFVTTEASYADYGAAIAEGIDEGYVRAFVSPRGRILGAAIAGEGSGEMIGEWAMAIQRKVPIYGVMMLQHSFPTMSFLSKRVAENWMMGRMESGFLRRMAGFFFRV